MFVLEANRKRPGKRRRQRQGLVNLIVVLIFILLVLVTLVLCLPKSSSDTTPPITLKTELTMEAGSTLPDPSGFLPADTQASISYSDSSQVCKDLPGLYPVTLTLDGKTATASIRVVDTVPPQATAVNLSAYSTRIPEAAEFVSNIIDCTQVTASYLTQPDKTQAGAQNITILLTDAGGNTATVSAVLTLTVDEAAPVISGAENILIYQGDTVQYRKNITVKDDYDTAPVLSVDQSQVDLNTPGQYRVTYTATDAAGNTSSVSILLTVMEKGENFVSLDVIYAAVDAQLDQIITPGMSDLQKVEAVYNFIVLNCQYISHSEKDNWIQAGYRMLMERRGDCFNYFGLCKLMLERLGIPNIDVQKVKNYPEDSNHYWSLVSVNGGQTYYHVDTTPRNDYIYLCMVTDAVIDAYSANHNNCFNRDKSLYPATPDGGPL